MQHEFNFVSFDRIETVTAGRLPDLFDHCLRLPYMIAKPDIAHKTPPSDVELPGVQRHDQRDALAGLPPELLLLIFDRIGLTDVIRLGFTCRRIWETAWPYAVDRIFGSWRGTRLVCEDRWDPRSHLPAAMLSPPEPEDCAGRCQQCGMKSHSRGIAPCYHWVLERGRIINPHYVPFKFSSLRDLFSRASCPLPELERIQADELTREDTFRAFFSPGLNWTLRNLTKKAFIRGSKLNAAFHSSPTTGLDLPCPGFSDVLVLQTIWAKKGHRVEGLECGDWIGDRFELLTDHDHDLVSTQSWTDESDRIIKAMATTLQRLQDPETERAIMDAIRDIPGDDNTDTDTDQNHESPEGGGCLGSEIDAGDHEAGSSPRTRPGRQKMWWHRRDVTMACSKSRSSRPTIGLCSEVL